MEEGWKGIVKEKTVDKHGWKCVQSKRGQESQIPHLLFFSWTDEREREKFDQKKERDLIPSAILFQMNSNKSRGRAIVFEHIPFIKFRNSLQGILFIVFSNGEAFFYPLNEQTKGNSHVPAKLLTTEPTGGRKFVRPSDSVATKSTLGGSVNATPETFKYFAYDVALNLNPDLHRVCNFNFLLEEDKTTQIPPRKILLSPDKKLLLILGTCYKGQSCLLVYSIQEDAAPDFFRLIFFDLSSTFVDLCFTPNSLCLAAVTTKYPSLIFILQLPIPASNGSSSGVRANRKVYFSANQENLHQREEAKPVNFEARRAGPWSIVGPAKGLFGHPIRITNIASTQINETETDMESFDLVTWNEAGSGEYCIWRMSISRTDNKLSKFETFPKYVSSKMPERRDIEEDDGPRYFILHVEFSSVEKKLLLVVKRENLGRKGDNGIGMQMIGSNEWLHVSKEDGNSIEKEQKSGQDVHWFQLTESMDSKDVLCAKWTIPLLLGNTHSGGVIVKGKGLFELVDFRYGSAFQGLYDSFVEEACNFVQVGKFHRFWISTGGSLRVIVVTPQVASSHPEWHELFQPNRPDIINMRILDRRIGYFINAIEKDVHSAESSSRRGIKREKDKSSDGTAIQLKYDNSVETLCGLHLYRCWGCKRVLLKPLQCSKCKAVVYCSRTCQRSDWTKHRLKC